MFTNAAHVVYKTGKQPHHPGSPSRRGSLALFCFPSFLITYKLQRSMLTITNSLQIIGLNRFTISRVLFETKLIILQNLSDSHNNPGQNQIQSPFQSLKAAKPMPHNSIVTSSYQFNPLCSGHKQARSSHPCSVDVNVSCNLASPPIPVHNSEAL